MTWWELTCKLEPTWHLLWSSVSNWFFCEWTFTGGFINPRQAGGIRV